MNNGTEKEDYRRHRHSLRLAEYDYNSDGAYFLTICTHDRVPFLASVVVGALHEAPTCRLTEYGSIVMDVMEEIPERFKVRITDVVVMPNYLHMIVWINNEEETTAQRALREAPLQSRSIISKVVGYLKMNASKRIHYVDPRLKVWQRQYYDHVIRGEKDYLRIAEYIQNNPARWTEDKYYIE